MDLPMLYNEAEEWGNALMLYDAALKEINTKLEILNNEFKLAHQYNPIEHLTSRLKTPQSIVKKLKRYGKDVDVDNIINHINDVAGIRIICSFTSDIYRIADLISTLSDIKVSQTSPGVVTVTTKFGLAPVESNQTVTYTIYSNGEIAVESSLTVHKTGLPDIPRVGMRWELPVNFDNLEFFGRGPHENYIDRKAGSFVDVYTSKVADQYFKYIRPQENGYKTDVRWFELRNQNNVGIRVKSDDALLGFSALHNPIEDFDQITHDDFRHTNDIVKKDGVFVCTDLKMMGVAGDNSWGATPYPQYSIKAQNYIFKFTIEPVF